MRRILVVGGDSRIGSAIARAAPGNVVVVRRRHGGGDNTIVVPDYKAIPGEAFDRCATVINCVGIAVGDASQLNEANVQIPTAIARRAAASGVELFVQMSSFSVFGTAPLIQRGQPTSPSSAYGQSKLQAEEALAQVWPKDRKLAIIRVPMLYGYGRSKLDDLLRLWLKLRIVPIPPGDVARSMLHYDLAANFVLWVVQNSNDGVFTAADPEPFAYRRVAKILRQQGALRVHMAAMPEMILAMVRFLRPALYASVFQNSLLSPDANDLLKAGMHSRLDEDIRRITRSMYDG